MDKLIKMKVQLPGDKGFTCYFPTLRDVKNFVEMVKDISGVATTESAKSS